MPLRDCIARVLSEYPAAMQQPFAGHPLADFVRHGFPDELARVYGDSVGYRCKGSAGNSQWTVTPWVAVFDVLITESAQHGVYPVYIFREDFSGVYLTLNQGVTEVLRDYHANADEVLRIRAQDMRARLTDIPRQFTDADIDLIPTTQQARLYEAGNVCSAFYDAAALPDGGRLIEDLRQMLILYQQCRDLPVVESEDTVAEGDADDATGHEGGRTLRLHNRIDRNPGLARKAKRIHGYVCQVCGFDFEQHYGAIGHEFIEAHHLVPLAELAAAGQRIRLDSRTDFAVLCANCHRMIHHTGRPDDITGFAANHLVRRPNE
jgi:5-methylcytosine-specific restriction enzyme A